MKKSIAITLVLLSLPIFAETYIADIAVSAGTQWIEKGEAIDLVVPMQARFTQDLGIAHRTLNPKRAALRTLTGLQVDAQITPVRIKGANQVGVRIRFAAPRRTQYHSTLRFELVFEDIGAELIGNSPDLPREPVGVSYEDVDFASTHRGGPWNFDPGAEPVMTGAWHSKAEHGVKPGYYIATADGEYSSPAIGELAGPIDGKRYRRVVVRAKRAGPTESSLLINNKTYPKNSRDSHILNEQFDIYTQVLTGNPQWGDKPEKLWFRWGYNAQPTAKDKVIIDWVRLLDAEHYAFMGAIRKASADIAVDGPSVDAIAAALAKFMPKAKPRPDAETFFKTAPDSGKDLPPDRIYPHGRQFGISLYSVGGGSHPLDEAGKQLPAEILQDRQIAAAVQRVKRDGFTMIGPQYELNHRIVKDAEAGGMKCVFTVGIDDKGHAWTNFVAERNVDADLDEVRRRAMEQVASVASSDAIAWWDITPEEIRWWRPKEMAYMKTMYEAVKAADPLKRPVYMYEPGNRAAVSLAKTLVNQDICGKGVYANYASQMDTRHAWIRWSIEQELEAIKLAKRPHAIAIGIPEMFAQPPQDKVQWVGKWAHNDAYTALVAGAKGILVFSMRIRDGFTAHNDYYEGFASVARDLNGDMNLADVFLFGERRDDLAVTPVDPKTHILMPDNFGVNLGGPVIYPAISWADIAYENSRYLIAVNGLHEPVEAKVTGLPTAGTSVLLQDLIHSPDQQTVKVGDLKTRFAPLEVKVWRFSLGS